MLPFKATLELFAQSVASAPALAVGAGVKLSVIASLTAMQLPTPVVVAVSVTLPLAISAAVGVYTGLTAVLPGVKVPAPPLQMMPAATVYPPFKMAFALLPHSVWSAPAVTVGAGVMV